MKGKIRLAICSLLALTLLLWASPALAMPPLPHAFYGSLAINSRSAAVSSTVSAKINGVDAGSYTTTVGGLYGSVATRDYLAVSCDGASDGDTINFYVNGYDTNQTSIFIVGGGPTELDLSITFTSGGDGGGGFPSAPDIETDLFGAEADFSIDEDGEIQETIEATSDAGDFTITIEEGTIALDEDGDPLSTLTVELDLDPPDPPAEAHIIGIPYKLGPSGATFDPAVKVEYTIDPATLPPGIDVADLVIAYYDEALVPPAWVEIPTTYDPVTNTFTGLASHFTVFAVIARAPAAFSLSSLFVYPTKVEPGETVTITVSIANTGGTEGDYTVVLTIDGVKETEKSVTVAAGDSEDVDFTVSREDAGSYSVVVDGLSGSFTVVAPPPTVPPPAAPPEVPPAAPPEVPPGVNWTIWGPIIGVAVFLAIFIPIRLRRRRRLG